ncbi:MAG: Inner membrane protein alx [Candidatus Accumulibacter regalis]|jgi:predicted tellurium resistance membrane protein TerC|uniref:Inner membrane protein alx n=1 Tax=Accumulibacter regalis TaxID=522306 RepID=A0A011PH31_ACCRE|nr:hypothetical protein [Accumulibacter sp.]EXI86886.1 MAG: Inner membrane protein alx [Candidatus Accumulibacter regalis]
MEKCPLLRWLRVHLRITPTFHSESLVVCQNGILWAPPMFLVLILVEATNVVFAIDSIPSIFLPPQVASATPMAVSSAWCSIVRRRFRRP